MAPLANPLLRGKIEKFPVTDGEYWHWGQNRSTKTKQRHFRLARHGNLTPTTRGDWLLAIQGGQTYSTKAHPSCKTQRYLTLGIVGAGGRISLRGRSAEPLFFTSYPPFFNLHFVPDAVLTP